MFDGALYDYTYLLIIFFFAVDKAVADSVAKLIPDRFKERVIEALESTRGKAAGTSHKLLVVCLPARVFVIFFHFRHVLLLTFTLISVNKCLEEYFEANPIELNECRKDHVEDQALSSDVIIVETDTSSNSNSSSSAKESDDL